MKMSSKFSRVLIGFVVAGALAACGGGSNQGGSGAIGAPTVEGSEVPIITLGNVPGIDDACIKITNMIGVSGQVIGGQVEPSAAKQIIDQFVAAVPSEIRGEAQQMASAYGKFIDVLAQNGNNFAMAMSNPEALAAFEEINRLDLDGTFERINAYLEEKCT